MHSLRLPLPRAIGLAAAGVFLGICSCSRSSSSCIVPGPCEGPPHEIELTFRNGVSESDRAAVNAHSSSDC